jgi:hypothetical protein
MTFRDYIRSRRRTRNPLGDFVGDAKADVDFPDVANFHQLVLYLRSYNAREAAVDAAQVWWKRFQRSNRRAV